MKLYKCTVLLILLTMLLQPSLASDAYIPIQVQPRLDIKQIDIGNKENICVSVHGNRFDNNIVGRCFKGSGKVRCNRTRIFTADNRESIVMNLMKEVLEKRNFTPIVCDKQQNRSIDIEIIKLSDAMTNPDRAGRLSEVVLKLTINNYGEIVEQYYYVGRMSNFRASLDDVVDHVEWLLAKVMWEISEDTDLFKKLI